MFILLLLVTVSNVSSSAPLSPLNNYFNPPPPFTIFDRELPQCINIAHCRTAQDIVWSCLGTIFACTWVAVHPNVPDPRNSGWTNLKQKITIVFYALLGPEFVTLWALRQYIGARKHVEKYNQKFPPKVQPRAPRSIFNWLHKPGRTPGTPWTLTHGFLLEMRGLIKIQDGKFIEFIETIGESPDMASDLSEPFDISEDEINDKSKGDFLAKLLVVLRATRFIFQCFARWITNLPVTELEVVTLAFAFLNTITYALWWNKPQNMYVPIPIHCHTPQKGPSCKACGSAAGKLEQGVVGDGPAGSDRHDDGTQSADHIHPPSPLEPLEIYEERYQREENATLSPDSPNSRPLGRTEHLLRGIEWICGYLRVFKQAVVRACSEVFLGIQNMSMLDWFLFVARPIEPLLSMLFDTSASGCSVIRPSAMLYTSQDTESRATYVPFCLVASVFGCLHLIPVWTSSFPSNLEKILWEISAFAIVIQPTLMLLFKLRTEFDNGKIAKFTFLSVVSVGGLVYVVARVVLLVLAFLTLRSLPAGAYQNVVWTTFLPHF